MSQDSKVLTKAIEYGVYLIAISLFTSGLFFRSITIYLLSMALVIRLLIDGQWSFGWKSPLFLLSAFCLSAIISSVLAPVPPDSFLWFFVLYLSAYLISIMVPIAFGKSSHLVKLVSLLALTTVFFIIMTFYDYATKTILPDGNVLYGPLRKYVPPLEFLAPFIPVAILLSKRKIIKLFWNIVFFAAIAAMVYTGVRGGWICLGVSLIIWAISYFYFTKNLKVIAFYIIGIIIEITVLVNTIPSSHLFHKIGQGLDTSGRFGMTWRASIENYKGFPLVHKIFGKGLDTAPMFQDFKKWFKREEGYYPDDTVPHDPHNFYLYILYQQGIIGLSIYLTLIAALTKKLYSVITESDSFTQKVLAVAVLSIFIGAYVVHGLTEDLKLIPLGFLIGIAMALTISDLNIIEDL